MIFPYKCCHSALTKTHMLLNVETKQCCCDLCASLLWYFIQQSPQKTRHAPHLPGDIRLQAASSEVVSLWWSAFLKDVSSSISVILRLFALLKLLHPSVTRSDLQKCGHQSALQIAKVNDGNPIPGTWHVHSCYFPACQVCLNSGKCCFLSPAWTSACLGKL